DMGVRRFFSHTNPDGTTDQQRIVAAGYVLGTPYQLAENIDRTRATGRAAFAAWEASPGHKATMVNPDLVAIGIGRVEVPGSPHGWYWTTTHANRFDAAPDC
ncbi:MAG: CAP domain-containing protein, partial [Chloroflexota bacterium]|nr:CAP domain-containing protein [Chloroflexota bacterium]